MKQWNLTIQRALPGSTGITLGYVGSRGRNLPRSIEDADQVPASLVTRSADGLLLFPTNPALKGGGPIARINPNYSRIATTVWDDFSDYHSLVMDFNRRFSRGLFFKTAYTWSKSIDGGSNTFSDNESTNTSGAGYAFFPALHLGGSDFHVTHPLVGRQRSSLPTPES